MISDESCCYVVYLCGVHMTDDADNTSAENEDIQGIIGLGRFSARKSYYPELQKKMEELRQERNKYERIFTGALGGIFQARLNGDIIVANPAMLSLCGYNSIEDLTRKGHLGNTLFAAPLDYEKLLTRLEVHGSVIGFETKFLRHDDSLLDVSLNASLRRDEQGVYLECFVDNITQRKQAEERHLKLKKLESLGVLAGGIAHDFNNLLTGLLGNIELTKYSLPDDHRAQALLDSAMTALNNATGLTTQLMTFAKGGDPVKRVVNLGSILENNATFILQGKNVELQCDIDPMLWQVDADPGQLGQVITNLVLNAQQAMPDGGQIRIKAENLTMAARPFVQFDVTDEGIGIPPEALENIFDPYFTTKAHGNGLGLASTFSIINKHKGSINVVSEPGKGTSFIVRLPAKGDTSSGADTGSSARGEERRKKVLIVDGEELVRSMASAMLEEMGYEAVSLSTAADVLERYRTIMQSGATFDLVILDLTLNGCKALAQDILNIDPGAKLIGASGYAGDVALSKLKECGFSDGIVKPFSFADLTNVIKRSLS